MLLNKFLFSDLKTEEELKMEYICGLNISRVSMNKTEELILYRLFLVHPKTWHFTRITLTKSTGIWLGKWREDARRCVYIYTIYICMYKCIYLYPRIESGAPIHTLTYTNTHIHKHTHTQTHTYTTTHLHTHVHLAAVRGHYTIQTHKQFQHYNTVRRYCYDNNIRSSKQYLFIAEMHCPLVAIALLERRTTAFWTQSTLLPTMTNPSRFEQCYSFVTVLPKPGGKIYIKKASSSNNVAARHVFSTCCNCERICDTGHVSHHYIAMQSHYDTHTRSRNKNTQLFKISPV